jgi:hypothetical protein
MSEFTAPEQKWYALTEPYQNERQTGKTQEAQVL